LKFIYGQVKGTFLENRTATVRGGKFPALSPPCWPVRTKCSCFTGSISHAQAKPRKNNEFERRKGISGWQGRGFVRRCGWPVALGPSIPSIVRGQNVPMAELKIAKCARPPPFQRSGSVEEKLEQKVCSQVHLLEVPFGWFSFGGFSTRRGV